MSLLLGHIVDALGGSLEGGATRDVVISRIAPLEVAGPGDLSFLSNPRYQQQLAASRAACVIVAPAMRDAALARGACIVADNPYVYFARATQLWRQRNAPAQRAGVHASAVVDPTAQVHPTATIGPLCVVERGAQVGAGTILKSRVTVGEDCTIGARCIVHAGVVIGADGFGFAPEQGQWVKIEQLGAVRIGDDVEIGANTCIDRGALQDTVIEDGVKLDNLIQIGHNCRIGAHSVIAGCVGIAGSAQVGRHCRIGGAAMILGHLSIADGVTISPGSMITRSIGKSGTYTALMPFQSHEDWLRTAANLRHLDSMAQRLKALEKEIAAIKAHGNE